MRLHRSHTALLGAGVHGHCRGWRARRLRHQRRSRFRSPSTDELTPWLQTRGELRTRVEGFTGGGFGDVSDAYRMDRFRLNATVRPPKSFAFVVQVQDARAFDKTTGSQAAPFRDTLDLRMAYGEIRRSTQHGPRSDARSWRSASSG